MPMEPSSTAARPRHADRAKRKESGHAKESGHSGHSKSALRESHPKPTAQSSKTSQEEIARLQEVIAQLQCEEQSWGGEAGEADLRWRINQLERDKLELTSRYNQEVLGYEAQVARLRAGVERGEAQRQTLEYDVAVARRDAAATEDKMADLHTHNQQLQVRVCDLEKALEITRQAREEDQQGLTAELHERDHLLLTAHTENDQLNTEKSRLEALLQAIEDMVAPKENSYLETERNHIKDVLNKDQEDTLQVLKGRMDKVQRERERDTESLRRQASELTYCTEREERLRRELEAALQRVKSLEECVESERAAHLESKFNSEIIQLRIRDLEAALSVEKSSQAEALSSLDLMKQQFGKVEKAYAHQRDKAKDTLDRLVQMEKDYLSTKVDLGNQLEQERRAAAQLTDGLQQQHTESQKRCVCVEEAYEGCLRQLEQLLQQYHHQGAPNTTGEGGKQSPSALMDILRRTLSHYHNSLEKTHTQLQDVMKERDQLHRDCREKEELLGKHRRSLEECQARLAAVSDDAVRLRGSCADAAARADRAQMELRDITARAQMELCDVTDRAQTELCDVTARADRAQAELRDVTVRWQAEKARWTNAQAENQRLTQLHQRESQEKLAFLYDLYQRLVAGCVLIASPPHGMLGSFSWAELSVVLQEHADTLTSDLNRANQKVSCLESVCESKSAALRELQQSQDGVFEGLTAQVRQREQDWVSQREELEKYAQEACERVCVLEGAGSEQAVDLARMQKVLGVCRRDGAALLAACAMLAGCVCPLYHQVAVLAQQKALLLDQAAASLVLEREVRTLLHALSITGDTEGKGHEQAQVRAVGSVWVFRRCAIAVLAALRLRALGRRGARGRMFQLERGYGDPPVAVCALMLRRGGEEEEEEEEENSRAVKWLKSFALSSLIHTCMEGLQDQLDKTDSGCVSPGVVAAARSGFAKLLDRLVSEADCGYRGRRYGEKGSLARRLGQGLHRLRTSQRVPPSQHTSKCMVASLQQHILVFTQRLHSAEVERRSLRLELSRLKRSVTQPRQELQDVPKHSACVPAQRFESLCSELASALEREQQAQTLLQEQAAQLHDLGLRMELHSGEEHEKDCTLAQAVKSLSEVKVELRRKEQSLRLLGKHLSQSQQEKQQLEHSISSAENALRMAAKTKDSLANYMRSVEGNLKEVTARIVVSRAAASRDDFTLQLPRMHLEMPGPERLMGGPEVAACQGLVSSFMEVYQLACSKMAALESEISSHQTHITALKTELQDACIRENQCYIPVTGSGDSLTPPLVSPVDCGTLRPALPRCSLASLSVPLRKTRGVRKAPSRGASKR